MTRWLLAGLWEVCRTCARPVTQRNVWRLLDALATLAGCALIVWGVALWSRPAGFVTAGVLCLALGLLPLDRRRA